MNTTWGNLKYVPKTSWLLWCMIFLFNLWSFSWVDLKTFQYIHLLIIIFFLITLLKKRIEKNSTIFSHWILLFMVLPLLSVPACKILNNQPIIDSLIVYRMHLGWLMYFVLSIKKTTEKQLVYVVVCMGLIYAFIVLLQQITYPFAPFGERTLGTAYANRFEDGVERRFGFYRFAVGGYVFAVFALLLYFAHQWRTNKIIVILLFFSIIATGNRQTIVSTLIAIVCYYILNVRTRKKYFYISILLILALFVYNCVTKIGGIFANVSDDLEEGRMHSYIYYYNEITNNFVSFFCGNGLPSAHSMYGQIIPYFMGKPVTPSDIGMLGTWFYWGGVYVCTYLFFIIRLCMNKYLDHFLKAYALFFLLTIWVSTPLWEIWGMAFQAMFIYYCELNIRRNKNNIRKAF